MNLASNMVINLYSIAILIIIYILSSKQDMKESLQNKLYIRMLQVTMLMLVMDILSRFDGRPESIYPYINQLGNFMIFLLNPIITSLWLLYVYNQIYQKDVFPKLLIYLLVAVNGINIVLLVLSQSYGLYYNINKDNIYQRGVLFGAAVSITGVLMLIAFILLLVNQNKMDKKQYFSLIFFAIPPSLCIILQVVLYGISFVLNGIVISLLIVFLNIQNRNMHIDFLTGVYNRKKLDGYMKKKIDLCSTHKTFSAIMLDLNNFKSINDSFGHDMGDKALQIAAKLLKKCLGTNDFLARFGGDEFCIILDTAVGVDLEKIVHKIENSFEVFNESRNQPFQLRLSLGYAVYDYYSKKSVQEFQRQIDILMYENKLVSKNLASIG